MRIDGKTTIAGLVISVLSTFTGTAAIAQEVFLSPAPVRASATPPLEYRNSVFDEFQNAYFYDDRDFFRNRSFPRQLDWLFGFSGFPENEITRDGREVSQTYQQILSRQMASGPIVRVVDLPTPFCQTLRTLPNPSGCGINGCAPNSCSLPTVTLSQPYAPVPIIPPSVEQPPAAQPTPPNVPALW
jgi:hypothetical protein